MLHLEFPPKFVHVAFTTASPPSYESFNNENEDPNFEQQGSDIKFAVMGDYGNNVNIYDTKTFEIKH